MGHMFLFRGSPKGRADSVDYWLAMLSADAAMLSHSMGGARSFARLAERIESLAVERRRKGRAKYRQAAEELIGELLESETMLGKPRKSTAPVYPSLALHLQKKARYALRLVRGTADAPVVSGASAMKEAAFYLSLVRQTAELCPQYLDPSERTLMAQAREAEECLSDCCHRAAIYGAIGEGAEAGYELFLTEADEAVTSYRRFLAELDARAEEGRLFSVFPPTFLAWADGTCALAHRYLKRIARGKTVLDMADESEEEVIVEAPRAQSLLPIAVLAESDGAEEEPIEVQIDEEELGEERAGDAVGEAAQEPVDDAQKEDAPPAVERIYAKASDYKNVVEKVMQKQKESRIVKPRPLGKGR